MNKYSIKNLLRFTDRGSSSLANSMLDYIMSHDQIDHDFALYQLANFRKKGSLIESCFEKQGLDRMAKEDLRKYMYGNGKGQFINDKPPGKSNGDEVINVNSEISNGKDRFVCWKLDHRGILGESLLHVLVICNTEIHTYIAMFLIELYPALAKDIVEGNEYYGASALHFAIANENENLIKKLIEAGADVDQRAKGTFFLPVDQQWPVPRKETNFEGLSYLGEYPLAWAACWDDESTYNLLIKHGADPQAQDTFGNSLLHVVVVRDRVKMYGYALRHPIKPASDRSLNKYGLTPLTLACRLGRNKIFTEMMEFSSLEFWRYSNITCSGYPLTALDSLRANGQINLNSALMIILNGNKPEHLDMLEGGVIQRLLEEKWNTFAKRCFYNRLIMMLLHLLNLSLAIFLRPDIGKPLMKETDAYNIVRYCAEIGVCIGCVGIAIIQQAQEMLAQGVFRFAVALIRCPSKTAFVISCFLILSCIPCRINGDRKTEDTLLIIAVPLSWFFLIFYAGAVRLTGPFVTMIYSMLVGDMIRFAIIYVIFLFAFTQAFFFLFKNPICSTKIDLKKRFSSFSVTWMGLFQMTLGAYEYEDFRETFYHKLTQVVFTAFMIFTPILLLNMLIAMMGNTYCQVTIQSEKEWVKQWAKIIVVFESAINRKSAKDFVEQYSIKMKPDEDNNEVRGVIVIKRKKKSKAEEKKQALVLWKRLGKRIADGLEKSGGSAEALRKRYNIFQPKQAAIALPEYIRGPRVSEKCETTTEWKFVKSSPNADSNASMTNPDDLNDLLPKLSSTPSNTKTIHTTENAHQLNTENFKDIDPGFNDAQPFFPASSPPPYYQTQSPINHCHENNAFVLDEIISTASNSNNLTYSLIDTRVDHAQSGDQRHSEMQVSLVDPLPKEYFQRNDDCFAQNYKGLNNSELLVSEERKHPEKSKKRRKKLFKKSRVEDIRPQNTEDSSDEQRICVNIETKVVRRSKRSKNSTNRNEDLSIIEENYEMPDSKIKRKHKSLYCPAIKEHQVSDSQQDLKSNTQENISHVEQNTSLQSEEIQSVRPCPLKSREESKMRKDEW